MYSPWQYVEQYKNSKDLERVHQIALFMYTNMACNFGLNAADQPDSYSVKGYAGALLERTLATGVDLRIPQLKYLFAIHNQGNASAIQGARSRAEGVKPGVPDMMLPVSQFAYAPNNGANGLYIELKRPALMKAGQRKAEVVDRSAGKASTAQEEWQAFLREQGYVCEVCYGWESARDLILSYLREGGLIR